MIKTLFPAALIALLFSANIFAQCAEPSANSFTKTIATKSFEVKSNAAQDEMILTIKASAENSSWLTKDAESAVLTVFVDGKYNQDMMLFAGAESHEYKVILGKLSNGKHEAKIFLNEARSAKNIGKVKLDSLAIAPFKSASPEDFVALANVPVLYARPDTVDKYSDIPLHTYYEIVPTEKDAYKIRYTTIFTNEDGGTQTAALMSRWGRMTDIEYVYEIDVKNGVITSEIIQGANHVNKNFQGARLFGSHPAIYDVTVNNNFADQGCSPMRIALLPIRADLSKGSRETVMDANPWTYRIMAQEAIREGRVNPEKMDANTIADLRDYVYAEIHNEPNASAVSLEFKTPDGQTIASDAASKLLRVDRPGYFRIALRTPKELRGNFPKTLTLACWEKGNNTAKTAESYCGNLNLVKVVRLDENYKPMERKLFTQPKTIKAGGKTKYIIK